jgi:hypothetical protein
VLQDIDLIAAHENVRHSLTPGNYTEFTNVQGFDQLQNQFEQFRQSISAPPPKLWNSYIEMVQLFLQFIRSTRQGDWHLHVACIREMIPWMFAYDRLNYAKYLPVYLADMLSLDSEHPEAYKHFLLGEFAVQRSTNAFAQVPRDQAIEQTLNRATKTRGGIRIKKDNADVVKVIDFVHSSLIIHLLVHQLTI